ncbi:hypothetical protein H2200_000448 [Cladophialophora chaetospira]|uniref:Sphingoid long-chain base transporter RSB1 n=1 Tax=Cladophialophora chaetospira TaxID=386627 RepID=A0AA38XNJ8_9EURO|nr:hypothetical protein H2200_000448 [Cladophialophora chaetospira]
MSDRDCGDITYGYVDPNWPRPNTDDSACIIIYGYVPSLALGILGVALFGIALISHTYLLVRNKTWYFSTVIVGLVMEIIGYAFRLLASQKNPYSVPYFVAQYFCIVVAPVFFSAAIYTILSVLISAVGRKYAPLSPKLILWIFIACDVIATVVQITGAALVGSAYSNQRDPTTANNILLGGLAFQVFSFAVFILCFVLFVYKARKVMSKDLKVFSAVVMIATLAVYLRTCFRLAETAEGLLEYLSTHEAFFGCLEFLPIVVAVHLLNWWHPGRWIEKT